MSNKTEYFLQNKDGRYYTCENQNNWAVLLTDLPTPVRGVIGSSEGLADHSKPIVFSGAARKILMYAAHNAVDSLGVETICILSFLNTRLPLNFYTSLNKMFEEQYSITPHSPEITAKIFSENPKTAPIAEQIK